MKFPGYFITTLILVSWLFCPGARAETLSKVLILPFNIYSEKDLSFLQNGVQEMLFTRLAQAEKASVLDRDITREAMSGISGVDEKTAAALGAKFRADYVIFGSLTIFGDSVSTDGRVYDTAQKKTALTFNDTGKNNGDVITHINRFATRLNEQFFGAPPEVTAGKPATAPAPAVEESRKNPEALWKGRAGTGETETGEDTAFQGNMPGNAWKSRHFRLEINGIAVGDTDGDGSKEVVFIEDQGISVYRNTGGRFVKVAEIRGESTDHMIGVDAADINENGKAEIFVTNINKSNQILRSFVLEWNGTGFQKIVEDDRQYYRVVKVPDQGPALMGQRSSTRKLFAGGIDRLQWQNGQYTPVEPQILPGWVNVFGFSYGKAPGNDANMIIAFSEKDNLRLVASDNQVEWESTDPYGGTTLYLEYPDKASSSLSDYREQIRQYLPQRILVRDMDNDGKPEVIAVRNTDAANRLLSRVRVFKSGHIECLGWDNLGLAPKWKTREISGHISDFAIADIDNDGQDELVFSVVQSRDSVIGSARSYIAAYELEAKK